MHSLIRSPMAIFSIALTIKALLIFIVIPVFAVQLSSQYGLNTFSDGYHKIAYTLVRGYGYRVYPDTALTLMREPGYPLFLAGVFSIFGYSLTAAKAANLLLTFAAAGLIFRLASRFSVDRLVTMGAPLLFLFHPGVIIAESRGGFEILFIFTLLVFMVLLYRARASGRPVDYLLVGLSLGVAILVKSTPLLYPLFLLTVLVLFDRRGSPPLASIKNIAIMGLGAMIVLSPWVVRNYSLTQKIIPTASVFGVSAHSGQYICKNTSLSTNFRELDRAGSKERERLAIEQGYDFKKTYFQLFYNTADEIAFHTYLKQRVIDEYVRSPSLFLKCISSNLIKFWLAGKSWASTAANALIQVPLVVLAAFGAYLIVRQGKLVLLTPLALFILYYWAVHLPILGQARYSIPIVPFLAVPASFALAHFLARFRKGGAPPGAD